MLGAMQPTRTLTADYLVIGAGAAGMAFVDALIDHADVSVVMVDRQDSVGGHWLRAYPFVRLHQASDFYGVASTVLGGGRIQQGGPEAGLRDRASAAEICAYYRRILLDRFLASGKVTFFPNVDYVGHRQFVSRLSGQRYEVGPATRVVDARYLEPTVPATTPPPFGVSQDAQVVPVGDLVRVDGAPSRYVIVGSGKTATDACVWLLGNGVDPGAITWVRPRDPWMLNRAVVQPAPGVFLGMVADMCDAATEADSIDDFFARLEDADVMLRIDPTVMPTMARAPTLGRWELDLLRTIDDVVRLGRVRHVERGRVVLDEGEVKVEDDALVVHCAAAGLQSPPPVPVWGDDVITLQLIRAGFPCLNAALAGYVEATRDDDREKNRLGPPCSYGNTLEDWVRMQVLGYRASTVFGAEPDIRSWLNSVALNPARVDPEHAGDAPVVAALQRLDGDAVRGMQSMADLCGSGEDAVSER